LDDGSRPPAGHGEEGTSRRTHDSDSTSSASLDREINATNSVHWFVIRCGDSELTVHRWNSETASAAGATAITHSSTTRLAAASTDRSGRRRRTWQWLRIRPSSSPVTGQLALGPTWYCSETCWLQFARRSPLSRDRVGPCPKLSRPNPALAMTRSGATCSRPLAQFLRSWF
jgi:hypothetical protein